MLTDDKSNPPSEAINRNVKILLAEDDYLNRKFIIYFLEKSGYNVDYATNGLEVLTALEDNTFDIILMDIHMPQMDGIETTMKIRQSESKPFQYIPIIALTAHALSIAKEKVFSSGMNDFVSKPVNLDELLIKIDTLLANQGGVKNIQPCIDTTSETSSYKEDIQLFIDTTMSDMEFLKETLQSFPIDVDERLGRLESAIHTKNTKEIAVATHKFIALFSSIFIDSASTISHKLQILARANKFDQCERLFLQLKKLMLEVVDYINSIKVDYEP
ncbi:MAG: response regulator [Candidatus Magnetomorum sp.]|nr:response regulator [Candidatus Magnetomorum sp.]